MISDDPAKADHGGSAVAGNVQASCLVSPD